jgi:Outer membrane protein beta-barrel domain
MTTGQSKFQIGLRTGVNFSSLSGATPELNESFLPEENNPYVRNFYSYKISNDFFNDAIIRPSFLLFINYRLTNNLGALVGVGFNGRGTNLLNSKSFERDRSVGNVEIYDFAGFTFIRKIQTSYLSIPVGLKYTIGKKQLFFVSGGVYFDLLVNSKIEGTSYHIGRTDQISNGDYEQTMSTTGYSRIQGEPTQTSKFDFGFSFESGVNVPLNSKISFVFMIGVSCGFIQIDNKYDNDTRYFPNTSGSTTMWHGNYHGLNSNARNMTLSNSIGLTYQL